MAPGAWIIRLWETHLRGLGAFDLFRLSCKKKEVHSETVALNGIVVQNKKSGNATSKAGFYSSSLSLITVEGSPGLMVT